MVSIKIQRGAAMVEFALIALLFFVILFGIIEFARAMFVYNTLVEATRRGARVAAVCPVSSTGINQVELSTIFDTPEDGKDTPLLGLTTNNVIVKYFDSTMIEITTLPADNEVTSPIYDNIAFVQVAIAQPDDEGKIEFLHNLIIPGFSGSFNVPPIATTLPSESLGRTGANNPVTQRCCYGVCVLP